MNKIGFDPRDDDFQRDPYPGYARLRREEPVNHRVVDGGHHVWTLSRYEDVDSALRDPRLGTVKLDGNLLQTLLAQPDSPFYTLARIVSGALLIKDGEDHARLRALVNKAFTRRRVEALRPRVQAIVAELLDGLAPRGELELLSDLVAPLPIIVIAELLGVPPEDRSRLREWSDHIATFLDGTTRMAGLQAAASAAVALGAYLEKIVEARRAEPRDDLISALVHARDAGQRLDENELLATVALVLGAGHETTTNLIGNGTLALLRHPAELEHLRREPGLLRSAVEELLRYDGPVQLTSRIPHEAVEVRGVRIPAGHEVVLYLGSANRDPEVFADPERLDPGRHPNPHLAFGKGAHFCLGAALARLEGEVALAALLERLPGLELATQALEWRPGVVLRGLRALPLRFRATA